MLYPNQIRSKTDNKIAIAPLSDNAASLIENFKKFFKGKLSSAPFKSPYASIADILIIKYNLSNIDEMGLPDFSNKTEFLAKGVRGNVQKSEGNILNYKEGENLINEALTLTIP